MKVSRLLELRTMDYADYLKTPEWQAIRNEAIRRAKGCCQICNSGSSLHVHHRTYENRGDEDLSDLTVLCADCHRIYHDAGKIREGFNGPNERPWYSDEELELIRH